MVHVDTHFIALLFATNLEIMHRLISAQMFFKQHKKSIRTDIIKNSILPMDHENFAKLHISLAKTTGIFLTV